MMKGPGADRNTTPTEEMNLLQSTPPSLYKERLSAGSGNLSHHQLLIHETNILPLSPISESLHVINRHERQTQA